MKRVSRRSEKTWPADAVERRPVDSLVPYARNARTHSPEQISQIVASIREWGWTVPVLIDEAGGLIAGHGRVLAAKSLGLAEVPVMVARGWSEAQKRAYVLADNRLALGAGWDDALLKIELGDLQGLGFDLALTGFGDLELGAIFADKTAGLTDPDEAPEAPGNPVTVFGDVWLLGSHRLVCGDSTSAESVALALNGVKPHLMVTDPPYGVSFERGKFVGRSKKAKGPTFAPIANDDLQGEEMAAFIAAVLDAWGVESGSAYLWSPPLATGFDIFGGMERAGFKVQSQIIWNKTPFVIGRADYHWKHEVCWYGHKGKNHVWVGGRNKATVWDIPKAQRMESHPTTKPVECMKRPIENNSSPGQAVYEPFAGSSTTIIACEMTGRHCHAIELSPAYVDVGVTRWQNFTGNVATLEATGQTFAEVMGERRLKAMLSDPVDAPPASVQFA